MHGPQLLCLGALALIGALVMAAMFDFTADDAYIVLRYAQNLTARGTLEYNWGEQINALTSPLNLFLMAELNLLVPDPILANKALGIVCLLGTLVLGWRSIGLEYATEKSLAALFQILF